MIWYLKLKSSGKAKLSPETIVFEFQCVERYVSIKNSESSAKIRRVNYWFPIQWSCSLMNQLQVLIRSRLSLLLTNWDLWLNKAKRSFSLFTRHLQIFLIFLIHCCFWLMEKCFIKEKQKMLLLNSRKSPTCSFLFTCSSWY